MREKNSLLAIFGVFLYFYSQKTKGDFNPFLIELSNSVLIAHNQFKSATKWLNFLSFTQSIIPFGQDQNEHLKTIMNKKMTTTTTTVLSLAPSLITYDVSICVCVLYGYDKNPNNGLFFLYSIIDLWIHV